MTDESKSVRFLGRSPSLLTHQVCFAVVCETKNPEVMTGKLLAPEASSAPATWYPPGGLCPDIWVRELAVLCEDSLQIQFAPASLRVYFQGLPF